MTFRYGGNIMPIAASAFAKELYGVVAARHSKDHPLISMIEHGELNHEQLLGFSVQFYQLFAKVFPKPIAMLYARCPDDYDIEKHLLENLIEEGTGQVSGSAMATAPTAMRPVVQSQTATMPVLTTIAALRQVSVTPKSVISRSCRRNAWVCSSTVERTKASSSLGRAKSFTVRMFV